MSRDLLRVENLVIGPRGGGPPVVDRVSFSVAPGEIVALIGESGSGKTTVSLASLGHVRPGLAVRDGHVWLDGTDMLRAGPAELRRLRGSCIAYVAQSAAAAFNPAFRLDAQVTEPARLHGSGRGRSALRAAAAALYRRMDLPDPERIGRRYPHEVSGGQLQRFMLAMALIGEPRLIVLDEPTSALDPTTQVEILAAIRAATAMRQVAAIFVSHDLPVVAQLADRIVVMRRGAMVESGTTDQVLHAPAEPYTRQLLEAFRQRSRPSTGGSGTVAAPPALTLDRVGAGYGTTVAVAEASFSVGPGEVVAVIGESGSGKTTLAHVVAGIRAPWSGTVRLNGELLSAARSREERRRIQIVFQSADTALNPKHSVATILDRVLRLYWPMTPVRRRTRIGELLAMVQLRPDHAARWPAQLSGGEKQRVALARALAAEPDVLVCDEVTAPLDTIVAGEVTALIARLCRERRLAVLLICHDLPTVSGLADEVKVMRAGTIVEAGPPAALFGAPAHPYTRLLVDSVPQLRRGWLEEAIRARAGQAPGARDPARIA